MLILYCVIMLILFKTYAGIVLLQYFFKFDPVFLRFGTLILYVTF